jgi:hypothetical protein
MEHINPLSIGRMFRAYQSGTNLLALLEKLIANKALGFPLKPVRTMSL